MNRSRWVLDVHSQISLCKIAKLLPNKEQPLQIAEHDSVTFNEDPNCRILRYREQIWEKLFDFNATELIQVVSENKGILYLCWLSSSSDGSDDHTTYLVISHTRCCKTIKNEESMHRLYSLIFPTYNEKLYRKQLEPMARDISDDEHNSTDEDEEDSAATTNLSFKLFRALKNAHVMNKLSLLRQPKIDLLSQFKPTLCPYQRKTIEWMYYRERCNDTIPHFYREMIAKDGKTKVLMNVLYPIFHTIEPPPTDIVIPPGGILAEEMGLGKTVEMIAIILLNPRITSKNSTVDPVPLKRSKLSVKSEKLFCNYLRNSYTMKSEKLFCICLRKSYTNLIECTKCHLWQHYSCVCSYNDDHDDDTNYPYICPKCWQTEPQLVKSAATVIVSPNSIKMQWLSEIQKHTEPSLKALLYEGISRGNWISPRQLAAYDVIVTDYLTLQKDIHFTPDNQSSFVLRKKSKSMRVNSPIIMVEWWRVCLDEAQMVESCRSMAGQMVRRLPTVIRWNVTGTPIQKSIDDIKPLLDFIGLIQFSEMPSIWNALVCDFVRRDPSSQHLVAILQKCMWRTSKLDAIDQLNIPPQKEIVHYVQFDDFEKLHYSEQHTLCTAAFNVAIEKYLTDTDTSPTTAEISPRILTNILKPFLRIRQCCTVPVVVGPKMHKSATVQFLQPKELHVHLKSVNETNCKTLLRTMASSYNGMAAIYFIEEKYDEAIRHYELVLKLARDYTDNITVDSLLQIHALHNIMQAYYSQRDKEPSPKMIAEYETRCTTLEWKFLQTYVLLLEKAQSSYTSAYDVRLKAESTATHTMEQLIEVVLNESHIETQLVVKLTDELAVYDRNSIIESMDQITPYTVLYTVHIWYDKLIKTQKKIAQEIKKLEFFLTSTRSRDRVQPARSRFIQSVYDCHLSEIHDQKPKKHQNSVENPTAALTETNKKQLCQLCTLRKIIDKYECLLFNKVLDEQKDHAEGVANPSQQLTIVRVVFMFARSKSLFYKYMDQLDLHLEVINNFKIEYKELIKFWIEMEYTVKAYDELNMCKMRIAVAEVDEELSNFKIAQYEINDIFHEQKLNLMKAQHEFTLKLARLKYVQHLEKKSDPGTCPICQSDEHTQYAVLECGHHICLFCLNAMKKHARIQKITCSVCRNVQLFQNIYYVTRTKSVDDVDINAVCGDYSSKIVAIVREVVKLQSSNEADPPKIIIFSQWEPILSTISEALKDNKIQHKLKWSPQSIEQFKDPHLGITCLLMLLSRGSKGLNLVEATHVFLVEAILNPGEELQAIGRVHRIGQTRPTTVHRFIVENTIEQNIYNAVTKDKQTKFKSNTMTIDSIKRLFHLEDE